MANTLLIKRSTATAAPSTLENGELAYSQVGATGKLYIGRPGGTTGDVDAIGGKYYVDRSETAYGWGNHALAGYLTAQYSLPEATSTVRGGIELFSDTDQAIAANAVSSTASRTYGIQLNSAGQAVVNVPWVDTNTVYTLPVATDTALGGIELFSNVDQTVAANAVTTTASRTYGLQLNAANQGVINVPWTDTVYTLPAATSTVRGGIELFSDTVNVTAANAVTATSARTYGIQVNNTGQAVVNVPWTDTTQTTVANLSGGSAGTLPYQSGANATAMLAAGTSGYILRANGAAAPSWTINDLTSFPTSNFKKSVKVATTANITLSGLQTIDGVLLVNGDRVLVKNQTALPDNGIYIALSGTWARSTAADGSNEIDSAVVGVEAGTVNGGLFYTNVFKSTDTVGTTLMPWYKVTTELDQTTTNTAHKIVLRDGSGNFSAGTITATGFSGSGASLTALNATQLTTGTVPDARISGSYTGMTNLTGTGTVDFSKFYGNGADTAALPSFSWTTDPNTGIWNSAADTIGFTTGGTNRITINSSGISGAGSGLTSLNASNLASGTVPVARIPALGYLPISGGTLTGALTVTGDFTVNGTITTVNTEEVTIADNNIRLNGNFLTGIPSENAGISVRRGGFADVALQWNEGTDKWEVTTDGSVYSNLLTAANFPTEFTGTIDGGTF